MSPERIRPGSAPRGPDRDPKDNTSVDHVGDLDQTSPTKSSDQGDDALTTARVEDVAHDSLVTTATEPEQELSSDSGDRRRTRRRGFFHRLYYGETSIDFVGRRRSWFTASAILISIGAVALGLRGLNFGIDFVGGNSWTVPVKSVSVPKIENALSLYGLKGATITVLGNRSTGSQTLEVESKLTKNQSSASITKQSNDVSVIIARITHTTPGAVSIETVGPSWGGQVTHKAFVALIAFFILVSLYISVFFEWRMALAAVLAVLHDIMITVGVYAVTGIEVTPDTVVAILTILGYSLYDTIVVFDRVRDNTRHLSVRDRLTFSDVVNISMNQTLARSINTTLVAIMPILSVLVLGAQILGATTLEDFGLALLVGLTAGAYSSIFIASPLVAVLKEREPRYRQLRERLALRGGDRVALTPAAIAAGNFSAMFTTPPSRSTASSNGSENRIRPGAGASPQERTTTPVGDEARERSPKPRTSRPASTPGGPRRPAARRRKKGGHR